MNVALNPWNFPEIITLQQDIEDREVPPSCILAEAFLGLIWSPCWWIPWKTTHLYAGIQGQDVPDGLVYVKLPACTNPPHPR